jgi:hypothetical protein
MKMKSDFELRLKHDENEIKFLIRFYRKRRNCMNAVYKESSSSDVLWTE